MFGFLGFFDLKLCADFLGIYQWVDWPNTVDLRKLSHNENNSSFNYLTNCPEIASFHSSLMLSMMIFRTRSIHVRITTLP